jgi:hypothetical protein
LISFPSEATSPGFCSVIGRPEPCPRGYASDPKLEERIDEIIEEYRANIRKFVFQVYPIEGPTAYVPASPVLPLPLSAVTC